MAPGVYPWLSTDFSDTFLTDKTDARPQARVDQR